jgi:hypothetical protein
VLYHLLSHFTPQIGASLPALLLAGSLQWGLGQGRQWLAVGESR